MQFCSSILRGNSERSVKKEKRVKNNHIFECSKSNGPFLLRLVAENELIVMFKVNRDRYNIDAPGC